MNNDNFFQSGEIVPLTGIYRMVTPVNQHITVLHLEQGERFPLSHGRECLWFLVAWDEVHHAQYAAVVG